MNRNKNSFIDRVERFKDSPSEGKELLDDLKKLEDELDAEEEKIKKINKKGD